MIQGPATPANLTTEFEYISRHHISLAAPIVSLLNLYLRLWKCYIVDSALKIQLGEEQGQLQRSIKWLTTECDATIRLWSYLAAGKPWLLWMMGLSRFWGQARHTLTGWSSWTSLYSTMECETSWVSCLIACTLCMWFIRCIRCIRLLVFVVASINCSWIMCASFLPSR